MIIGYFKSVEVPPVPVGGSIAATIDFYAINPGALYWATFLVADCPGLGVRLLLDKAREIGQEGTRKKTYTIGAMPNREIAISFFLFAHDDAGYDWNWSEYLAWLDGFPGKITHLASEYRFLSPPAPTPLPEPTPAKDVLVTATSFIISYAPAPVPVAKDVKVADAAFTIKYRVAVPPPPPVACRVDADCPEGYICQNGVCVKKEEEIPWALLGIGALALLALAPKEKK